MKFLTKKPLYALCLAAGLLSSSSLYADNATIHEYNVPEAGPNKWHSVQWHESPVLSSCQIADGKWKNKMYRVTLRKSGIQKKFWGNPEDFGTYTTYTNGVNYVFAHFAEDTDYPTRFDAQIGDQFTALIECHNNFGLIKEVGTVEFTYDLHKLTTKYPVDINKHSRKLRHLDSNKCLYPLAGPLTQPWLTRIRAADCNTNKDLAFEILDAGTGVNNEIKLKSQRLNQCIRPLHHSNGTALKVGSCNDNEKTTFIIETINFPFPEYRFRHKQSNKCLYNYDVSNTAHLWDCYEPVSSTKIFKLDQF